LVARRPRPIDPDFAPRYWPFKTLFDDGAMVHEKGTQADRMAFSARGCLAVFRIGESVINLY